MKTLRTKRHRLLCQLLAQSRRDANLTQRQLAERLGKPHSYIAKIENGERRLDVIEFLDLAKAAEVNALDLMNRLNRT